MRELGAVFAVAIVGIVILAIVGFVWQQKKTAEREQAFGRLAAANGLQYITEDKSYARRFDDGEKPFRSLGGGRARTTSRTAATRNRSTPSPGSI